MARRRLDTHIDVDLPYDDATLLLAEDAAGVLQAATDSAVLHAEGVVARLRVGVGGFEVGRPVEIEVGEFRPVGIMHVVVPLRWHARDSRALFPSMDASLAVRMVPTDAGRSRVALTGSYAVPLGPVGAALDHVALHRVAEAAVRRFVGEIATGLEHVHATARASR